MLKQIAKRLLGIAGLKIQRLPRSSNLSGPILFGSFTVETDNAELIRSYRIFPESNTVIARLVSHLARQGPIALVDIGANCGDSLAIAKTGSIESEVLCIEGEEGMLPTLKKNARQFSGVTIKNVYLGETASYVNVSIENRGWNNTLAPDENGKTIRIETLDNVVRDWTALPRLRFIKCDTEGYDIRILWGAHETLRTYRPVLLFEYNRVAMCATGEEGLRIFSYLAGLGYRHALIYDNFGRFLLSSELTDKDLIRDLHDYADGKAKGICYYDILAFSEKDATFASHFLEEERLHRDKA